MPERTTVVRHIAETRRRLRRRFAEAESHPLLHLNVTMSQLKVMVILSESPGASSQDLARSTNVGLATMTGILDRLVAQQLVTRSEDPHDRRVRRLELTPAGSELIEGVLTAGEQAQEKLLQRLDLPSLEIVARAFDLILQAATSGPDDATIPDPPSSGAVAGQTPDRHPGR